MKLFEFDEESKYYKAGTQNVDQDKRLKKKALEEAVDGGFEFGEFYIQLPSSDAEAKEQAVSLGAAGFEPYIETALQSNDPEIFRKAALDLEMIMPSIENHLMNSIMDEKMVNVFMHEMNEIFHWMRGGYKKNVKFKDGQWHDITYGDVDENLEEMFSVGYEGYKVFYVDEKVYQSLQGWFPGAHTTFDPADETATIRFDEPITDEIDRKMDRFNSNWQTRTMTLGKKVDVEEEIVPFDHEDPDLNWLDDETGEIFKHKPGSPEEKAEQEAEAEKRRVSYLQPAIQDMQQYVGDMTVAGGDAIDYLINQHYYDIEELDDAAVEMGFKDAQDYVDSFMQDEGINEEQLDEGILQDVFNFLWNATGKVLDSLPVIGKRREEARIKSEYDNFVEKMDDATTEKWIAELEAKLKSTHHATKKASTHRLGLLRKQVQQVKDSSSSKLFILHMRQLRRTLADFEKFVKKSNKGLADRKRKAKAANVTEAGNSEFTQAAEMLYNERPDLFSQHGDEYVMGVLGDVLKHGQYGDLDQVVAATIQKVEGGLESDDYIGEELEELVRMVKAINTK